MAILRIQNLTKDYKMGFWGSGTEHSTAEHGVHEGEIFDFGTMGQGKPQRLKFYCGSFFPPRTAWLLDQDWEAIQHHKIGYMPENPYFRFLTEKSFCAFTLGWRGYS